MSDVAEKSKADEKKAEKPKTHKVTYVPAPGDPATTTWRGQNFVAGQAVDVTDDEWAEAARNNPNFAVDDQKVDHSKSAEEATEKAINDEIAQHEAELAKDTAELNGRQKGEFEALQAKHDAERELMQRRHDALGKQVDMIRKRHELIKRQRVEREGLLNITTTAAQDVGQIDARHKQELEALTGKEAELRDLRLMTPTLDTESGPQPGKPSQGERRVPPKPSDKP